MKKFKPDGSTSVPFSNKAMELIKLLKEKRRNDKWFFARDINKVTGQLKRVFWMEQEQMSLYRRYHDVILNDTTAQTNPFGMPLNVTVAINNAGASRVVALALTRSEAASDFKWILQKIKVACGGKEPRFLVVDEDEAMECASREEFPNTHIVNCIWHMDQNFKKFVGTHFRFKEDDTQYLFDKFQLAKNAFTESEFEKVWSDLMLKYGRPPSGKQEADQHKGHQEGQDHESQEQSSLQECVPLSVLRRPII